MTTHDYQSLYNTTAALNCNTSQLNKIKEYFESAINSRRRVSSITTLQQLLSVLEKRDYLNSSNTEALKIICTLLNEPLVPQPVNNNSNVPQNPTENNNEATRVLPPIPSGAKERAYKLIAEEIGYKWNDFARALKVREGKIDELKFIPLTQRVYEILAYHEENCDRRVWKSTLFDALVIARRRDIQKEVQHIFDTC